MNGTSDGLTGKVAIITGASGGIGAAMTALFAHEGAKVVAADIREPTTAADDAIALDVSDASSWNAAVSATIERFGRLDILVNGAGVFQPRVIAEETAEGFMRHVMVNQLGVFLGMQAVLAPMRESGGGSIVNISSSAGLIGTPGTVSYTGTKWAVRGITKTAAIEFAPHGIRVNSIHPGTIHTPMVSSLISSPDVGKGNPMGRIGQAEEVARMALFLASEASSYSTGAEFVCDGGLCAA